MAGFARWLRPHSAPRRVSRVPTLAELLEFSPSDLAAVDIAVVNLACAEGLPGAEGLDVPACLGVIDGWADCVHRYTRDLMSSYLRDPAEYHNHIGFFRFLGMVTLLKHPTALGLTYQPKAIGNFDFSDSRDDLLHGLLTRKLGTCTSFPALFVAIGRRLHWPLHVAVAKGHVFCQWLGEDGRRLNLEGSGAGGGECFPDEHYRRWPREMDASDIAKGIYLRPLSRSEEFALFLETRGHCLVDNRRFDEARRAYAQAKRVAPAFAQYENHLYSLSLHEARANGPKRLVRRNVPATANWHATINEHSGHRPLFPTAVSIPGLIYH